MNFWDSELNPAAGTGKVVVTSILGGTRDYAFQADADGYSEDQRIILHKGDMVTTSAENGENTDFDFWEAYE